MWAATYKTKRGWTVRVTYKQRPASWKCCTTFIIKVGLIQTTLPQKKPQRLKWFFNEGPLLAHCTLFFHQEETAAGGGETCKWFAFPIPKGHNRAMLCRHYIRLKFPNNACRIGSRPVLLLPHFQLYVVNVAMKFRLIFYSRVTPPPPAPDVPAVN